MSCVWHGYDKNMTACAILVRCVQQTGKPVADVACPHGGDGDKCPFVRAKIAEGNSPD